MVPFAAVGASSSTTKVTEGKTKIGAAVHVPISNRLKGIRGTAYANCCVTFGFLAGDGQPALGSKLDFMRCWLVVGGGCGRANR